MEIGLIGAVVFGFITAAVAENKGKSPIRWFIYGTLASVIALAYVIAASPDQDVLDEREIKKGKKKRCRFCAELIRKEATRCKYCCRDIYDQPQISTNTKAGPTFEEWQVSQNQELSS